MLPIDLYDNMLFSWASSLVFSFSNLFYMILWAFLIHHVSSGSLGSSLPTDSTSLFLVWTGSLGISVSNFSSVTFLSSVILLSFASLWTQSAMLLRLSTHNVGKLLCLFATFFFTTLLMALVTTFSLPPFISGLKSALWRLFLLTLNSLFVLIFFAF